MIRGIGLDIVEVSRIARAMKSPRFLERILTEEERSVELTPHRVAGRWAAKEAVAKALSCDLSWHEVEVWNDESGAPYVKVLRLDALPSDAKIWISISHERGHAAAIAILEG